MCETVPDFRKGSWKSRFACVIHGNAIQILMSRLGRLLELYSGIENMLAKAARRLMFLATEEECLEHFDTATCGGYSG
jgi:hypothetical protein